MEWGIIMGGQRKGKIIKQFGGRAPGEINLRKAFSAGGWYIVSYDGSYYSLMESYKNLLKYKYGRSNIHLLSNYYISVGKGAGYLFYGPAIAFKHQEEAVEYKLINL